MASNPHIRTVKLRDARSLPPIVAAVLIFIAWEFGVRAFDVPTFIAPAPSEVFAVFIFEHDLIISNFYPTLFESLSGFIAGNLIAVCSAILFVHSRTFESALFPIAVFINTIPVLAIAPILVLIFGPGFTAKIVIVALICFFPTLVNMVRGLKAVSPQVLELARLLSATKSEIFWKIRVQASLPYLFAALKISSTTCVIGAIVAEWIGANEGFGALILDATFNLRAPLLYAAVIASSGLAVLIFWTVSMMERYFTRWNQEPN